MTKVTIFAGGPVPVLGAEPMCSDSLSRFTSKARSHQKHSVGYATLGQGIVSKKALSSKASTS
jgi:hypothetical protein